MKKIKIAFCVRDMKIGGVESVMIRTMEKLLENKNLEIVVITYSKIKREYRRMTKIYLFKIISINLRVAKLGN